MGSLVPDLRTFQQLRSTGMRHTGGSPKRGRPELFSCLRNGSCNWFHISFRITWVLERQTDRSFEIYLRNFSSRDYSVEQSKPKFIAYKGTRLARIADGE
jgi:hypothetical protein